MKKIVFFLSLVLIFTVIFSTSSVSAFTPVGFDINAKNALLVNFDTGERIFEKSVDERVYPASITKLMTALVTYENIADVKNTVIEANGEVLDSLLGTDSSTGGIKAGERLTVDQLLHYLLISSANDAAVILADYVGQGSIDTFVKMMNDKAKALGMNNTSFANPHGLHDEAHYSTVNDIYLLAKAAFKIPLIKEITSCSRYTMSATNKNSEKVLANTNFLLDPSTSYFYRYATGGKTGYTDSAGRCLVSTASKDGMEYMCIVMGCTVEDGVAPKRWDFIDSQNLYKWAYDTFEYKSIVDMNEPIGGINVDLSWDKDYISLLPEKSITALLPKDADKSTIIYKPELKQKRVDAPIKKGQVMGIARIYYAEEEIGQVNLVASEQVQRSMTLFLWKQVKMLLSSIWMKLIFVVVGIGIILFILITILQNRRRRKMKRLKLYKRI